jgi:hypothetical protein
VPARVPAVAREPGPGEECQGGREFRGPVGKDVQQQDTYGAGEHSMHANAAVAPSQAAKGRLRVAMTREAEAGLDD